MVWRWEKKMKKRERERNKKGIYERRVVIRRENKLKGVGDKMKGG